MRKSWRHLWIGLLLGPAAGLSEPAPMTGEAAARLEGFKRSPAPVTTVHKDLGMLTNRAPAVTVQGPMPLAGGRSSAGGPRAVTGAVTGAVDAAGRRLSTGSVLSEKAGKIKGDTGAATLMSDTDARAKVMRPSTKERIDRIIEEAKAQRHFMTNSQSVGGPRSEQHEIKPPEPRQDRHRK